MEKVMNTQYPSEMVEPLLLIVPQVHTLPWPAALVWACY